MSRKALGRGLEALIPRTVADKPSAPLMERGMVPVDRIRPNPWQPRRSSDPARMEELVRSIQARGVLEPLLVRPRGDGYELVAGERRLRAAQLIGIKDVPALVIELDDLGSLEVALIENLQREDLNPVDEARAYHLLVEEFGRTHDQISDQVGKERSTISNLLRLLKLPSEVLDLVADGTLSVGHARSILALPHPQDQKKWARRVIDAGWSVRETERRIANARRTPTTDLSSRPQLGAEKDPHIERVEEAIRRRVGTDVRLHVGKKKGGRLEFLYADQDDLERILDLLGVQIH